MNSRECMDILRAMAIGSSRTEKEAVEYVEKLIKRAKKAKRWKRKYLELQEKCYPRERRFTMPCDVPPDQMKKMLNGLVTIRRK